MGVDQRRLSLLVVGGACQAQCERRRDQHGGQTAWSECAGHQ